MIYLDTSALVKLVRPEPETGDLLDWLSDRPDTLLVSSALAEVELSRAIRRSAPTLLSGVPGVLGRIAVLEIDDVIRATAAAYTDPMVRSLDAIHLATADVALGDDLEEFVSYDKRLLDVATAIGFPVAAPGMVT